MTTPSNLLPPRSSTPFFRRPSLSNSLSSHSSRSTSSNSSSSDSDSSSSSNSDYPRRTSTRRHSSWSSASSSSTPFPPASTSSSLLPPTPPSVKRSDLKLSLTYLRARQSLLSSSYETLSTSLRTLSSLLPSSTPSKDAWESIGVFVPILERFVRDLREVLGGDEKGSKEYRKKLGKEDAKALVGLRQRWVGGGSTEGKGKGRGKEKDQGLEWVKRVEELVANDPPPEILSLVTDSVATFQTAALLNSIESLLLPSCSSPRISLANLHLTTSRLAQWTALERIQEIIELYLSFSGIGDPAELSRKARTVLDSVKSLDLSRNQLTSFPSFLPLLFPNLESLSLSHNAFPHLPPSLTLFSNLRRLKSHGNPLVQSHKALLPLHEDFSQAQREGKGTRANARQTLKDLSRRPPPSDSPEPVRSLFSTSLELLHSLPVPSPSTDDLPAHLSELLSSSYTCVSCSQFILPSSPSFVHPFFERLHFLSPGINLPTHSFSHTHSDSQANEEGKATLEQLVLLVAYQRVENAETSSSSKRFLREDEARKRERKGGGLECLVVGGDSKRDWRFCEECAGKHLGLRKGECGCGVCEEERRVREGEEEGQRVMRWLRRKERI